MKRFINLTIAVLIVAGLMVSTASASTFYPATYGTWAAYPGQSTTYGAAVQQPINADGSSNFKANGKAVIPVKFALSQGTGGVERTDHLEPAHHADRELPVHAGHLSRWIAPLDYHIE